MRVAKQQREIQRFGVVIQVESDQAWFILDREPLEEKLGFVQKGPLQIFVSRGDQGRCIVQLHDAAGLDYVFENNAGMKTIDERAAVRRVKPRAIGALVAADIGVKFSEFRLHSRGLTRG